MRYNETFNETKENIPSNFEYKVWCISWHENQNWSSFDISTTMNVYPCCVLHGKIEKKKEFIFDDEYLDSLPIGWNNLSNNSIEDIIKIYTKYIAPEKWKNDNTIPDCCKGCKIK